LGIIREFPTSSAADENFALEFGAAIRKEPARFDDRYRGVHDWPIGGLRRALRDADRLRPTN
jgi:hypothetical protein